MDESGLAPGGPEPQAAERDLAAAAEPGSTAAVDGGPITPAAACQQLGVPPYVLRALLDDYADWLAPAEAGLTPETVRRLATVVGWRAEGLSADAIRSRLAGGEGATDPLATLIARLGQVQAELTRGEERRAQDRDRLMMTLVRTQQEIQQLRHELGETRSRRDRRRGFWRRLFG